MLTAKVCVRYKDDWTADLDRFEGFGEFLASTFRERRYIGLITLKAVNMAGAIETISEHSTIEQVEMLEHYELDPMPEESATLLIRGQLTEYTPLQLLMYEGFLPLGPTKIENGRECFDLILANRDELSEATDLLSEFGPVTVERISQEFNRKVTPSTAEWQELLSSISPRQRETLSLALKEGYFEIPRETTLAELADAMGITKTTASNHLRKAEREFIEFFVRYLTLAADPA